MNLKISKCLAAPALALLSLVSVTAAEPPEMWIIPIDEKIPSSTPDGHLVNSLSFAFRVRGSGGYEKINVFRSFHFKMFTSAGKELLDLYHGNLRLPSIGDVVTLNADEVSQKVYTLVLRNEKLILLDGIGGVHQFEGASKGKFRLEVEFFDSLESKQVAEFEWPYYEGRVDAFFRGPVKKILEFEIGDIK